jgi:hypothetical protein
MTLYHIKTDYEPCDSDGVQLASIPVTIEFEYTPAGGDGWNEPRYDATIEYVGMTFTYQGYGWPGEAEIVKDRIEEWAAEWVEGDGRMVCIRAVDDAADMAREYAADLRRDRT